MLVLKFMEIRVSVVINIEANSSTVSSYELGQIKTIYIRSFI